MDFAFFYFSLNVGCNPQREQVNDIVIELHLCRIKCLDNRPAYLVQTKFRQYAIPLYNLKH